MGGIRSCYERALRNNPTLSGRLEVRFTIGTSGRVTSASSSGLSAAPEVGSCVVSRVRGLVFPTPEGGSVDFSFPFNFSPGG
jgi:TonB family protein